MSSVLPGTGWVMGRHLILWNWSFSQKRRRRPLMRPRRFLRGLACKFRSAGTWLAGSSTV